MSPIQVPADMPNVPMLAINRYPLFPGFIKKVDVRLDNVFGGKLKIKISDRER